VPAGDDIVGPTREFLYVGSPSVLATLWEVNDLSTVRLMRNFYSQIGTSDKATAVAKVQRDM
jgi:CHAT domain-containing protein